MTSTKAVAAGISAQFVIIANWVLTLLPHWSAVPDEVRSAVQTIVSAGIAAAFVYYAPANRHTAPAPVEEPGVIAQIEGGE